MSKGFIKNPYILRHGTHTHTHTQKPRLINESIFIV